MGDSTFGFSDSDCFVGVLVNSILTGEGSKGFSSTTNFGISSGKHFGWFLLCVDNDWHVTYRIYAFVSAENSTSLLQPFKIYRVFSLEGS